MGIVVPCFLCYIENFGNKRSNPLWETTVRNKSFNKLAIPEKKAYDCN